MISPATGKPSMSKKVPAHFSSKWRIKISNKHILLSGFFIYFAILLINPGFMGTDEYWTGITRYIPAQTQDYSNMMKPDDVKSPTQFIAFVATAHLALSLGVEQPFSQYRFVQIFLGVLGLLVLFSGLHFYIEDNKKFWTYAVFVFYFAGAFAFTRPMFESLSAPFVFLSALSLDRYRKFSYLTDILISTLAISIAFAFRPQAGIAALAIPFFVLLKKDWKAFGASAALGILAFVVLGVPDALYREGWHSSLKSILFYNIKHGAEYAVQPWYFYILLSLLVLWIPFFISKKFIGIVKTHFEEQKVFWTYTVLVLGLHSCFAQKWERFLIPVLPVMMLILAGWVQSFWEQGLRKRIYALITLNVLLWIPASLFPAQGNIIQLSLFVNDHPEIKVLHRLNKNPEWMTEAFIARKDWKWNEISQLPENFRCTERVVMNQKDYEILTSTYLAVEQIFETNIIEKFAYKMNPSKNQRRAPLYLLKPNGC